MTFLPVAMAWFVHANIGASMIIRCWGARGSIPVSGPNYLKYGGDTTCLEIRSQDGDILIVDAGTGIRRLGNRMAAQGDDRFTLLFTHSHWDHMIGFPFFKPIYNEQASFALYGCPMSQGGDMLELLGAIMKPPHFPVPFHDIKASIDYRGQCGQSAMAGPIEVSSVPISHPNLGLGYKFRENGRVAVFLTDNELCLRHHGGKKFEDYAEFCRGADLLIHDAEYTDEEYASTKGWGHSRYTDALRLALEAGVKSFGLFHHNQNRSDHELDAMVDDCRRRARVEGSSLECFALGQTTELTLD